MDPWIWTIPKLECSDNEQEINYNHIFSIVYVAEILTADNRNYEVLSLNVPYIIIKIFL